MVGIGSFAEPVELTSALGFSILSTDLGDGASCMPVYELAPRVTKSLCDSTFQTIPCSSLVSGSQVDVPERD